MRLFWIIHNNTCNTGRVIVEGLKKIRPDIRQLSSREDLIWLRPPSEGLFAGWKEKDLGHFPDSDSFMPDLATVGFWDELENSSEEDIVVLTVNSGENHNAGRAIEIIERKDMFHRTVILDEDESAVKGMNCFQNAYLRSRVLLVNLGAKVSDVWKDRRENVIFFCFNGMEDRYFPKNPAEKTIDVFFKSRVEGWLMPRAPFRDKLLEMDRNGLLGNSCIMPEFKESEGDKYLKLVSGDRHHPDYYDYLNRSRMAVYMNGFNPIGYQFWENCANGCLTLHQTPWESNYYNGGDHNYPYFHWEIYDPPFIPGEDFFYFETPEDLERVILKLMKNPTMVEKAADSCRRKAMNFTSERQARKFLQIMEEHIR